MKRFGLQVLGVVLALLQCYAGCCPEGTHPISFPKTLEMTQIAVPSSSAETCFDLAPPQVSFLITRYELRAFGTYSVGDLAPKYWPDGKAGSKATNGLGVQWPAPGRKEFALLYSVDGDPYTSVCGELDRSPRENAPTCPVEIPKAPAHVCFRINDWKLDDNRGTIYVNVSAKGTASQCEANGPKPVPPPIPGPGPVTGTTCESAGKSCTKDSQCCTKHCNQGYCGGTAPADAGSGTELGTFSCSGTITINGEECAKELGTATTCSKTAGAINCPAIREGCECTCSLGSCSGIP